MALKKRPGNIEPNSSNEIGIKLALHTELVKPNVFSLFFYVIHYQNIK